MTNHDNSIWATSRGAEVYAEAKRLWATTNMSVRAIARQLNINPGMLSGKAHRNRADFPPKGDPIKWKTPRRRAEPRVPRPKKEPAPPTEKQQRPKAFAGCESAARFFPPISATLRPRNPCSYPTSQGGGPIRFDCISPAAPGSPYCLEHYDLCFVKPRHRKQESPRGAKIEESCV